MDNLYCLHGCNSVEDEVHLFFKCLIAKLLWFSSRWSIRCHYTQVFDLTYIFNFMYDPCARLLVHQEDKESFLLLFFKLLWFGKHKNAMCFDATLLGMQLLSYDFVLLDRSSNSTPMLL